MAKKKKYLITHSNYTVKQTHKKLDSNRTIFERDYTVLNGVGNLSEDGIFDGLSTFKMVKREVPNGTKKHDYGEWLTSDVCEGGSETWTMDCLKNATTSDNENKIKLNPNYESLLSFAYYGSCRELLQTSLEHIVKKYPAELCFTNETHESGDYVVKNIMGIDIITTKKNNNATIEDLNILSEAYGAYEVLDSDENSLGHVTKYEVADKKDIRCLNNGDKICSSTLTYGNGEKIQFNIYKTFDGNIITTSEKKFEAYRIRPVKEYIDKFFNSLNDFEKLILNRDTVPSYTMRLDYPHETEKGIETYKKKFILPKENVYKGDEQKNGWNIDVSHGAYAYYVSKLLKLCDFYDERRTDNMWRSMTHDSIKNMDTSFDRGNSEDEDDYQIGSTRLKKILSIFGRFFDDLKRYIDNIKNVNNVSYNGGNNIPDYFLSDKLETSGWEVYSTSPNIDDSIQIGGLHSGNIRKYSSTDANIQFMKNLLLNSKHILAHKGTKSGIEMLLALFGMKSQNMIGKNELDDYNERVRSGNFEYPPYDYKIDEHVSVVKGVHETPIISTNTLKVEKYNSWRKDYSTENSADSLRGLPVRMVEYLASDGNTYKYIIPWFDKLQEVNGSPYFQMYGGWCKIPKRKIKNKYAPSINSIVTNNIDSVYEETIKYIRVVKTINDLATISDDAKKKNTIFYVINNGGWTILEEEMTIENVSHYFILKKPQSYYDIESENRGWENIPLSDIESGKNDGFKVLYLESIMDDHRGNNPHGGDYDDGKEYIEYFKKLFKYTIENGGFNDEAFDCETGEIEEDIIDCGFQLDDYVIDNVKTWYYTDTNGQNDLFVVKKDEDGKYVEESSNPLPKVGSYNTNNFFDSEVNPYNFEGGETYDEAAANSLINIKNLTIDFSGQCTAYEEFYDYFIKSILPFLKQMIPSTTIVNIKIKDTNDESDYPEDDKFGDESY